MKRIQKENNYNSFISYQRTTYPIPKTLQWSKNKHMRDAVKISHVKSTSLKLRTEHRIKLS